MVAGTAGNGYHLARMRHEIIVAQEAATDLSLLPANLRAEVRDAMERHLRYEPGRTSRSRIKRLRGLARPQYRLRVGEIRVYYDIRDAVVEVLAIVRKSESEEWLSREGETQ